MAKYKKLIYTLTSMILLVATFSGVSVWQGKVLSNSACNYWDKKPGFNPCEEFPEQLEFKYCGTLDYVLDSGNIGKQKVWMVDTHNNYCNDLIITKKWRKSYYTRFAHERSTDLSEVCGVKEHELLMRNHCD